MGCDIHVYTEKKNSTGKWECADNFILSEYSDETKRFVPNSFYQMRSYELFGLLAGVRRHSSKSLEPKGMPEGVSEQVAEFYESWSWDAHSSSYLNLRELVDLQDNAREGNIISGMVCPEDAEAIDKYATPPEFYCQYSSDPTWVYREWSTTHNPLDIFMSRLYTFLESRYWDYEIKDIRENPESFRVVFWFDN